MEWQYISSKANSLVIRMAKLKDKKYRKAEGLFRFDGVKLFYEAIEKGVKIEYVFVKESASEAIKLAVKESGIVAKVYLLSDDVFAKLTDEQSPEGVITVCPYLENVTVASDPLAIAKETKGKITLILESVRDAGNLGTIIRTAKAFSIDNLIISSDCADVYNPKTVRAAMGALFSQNIVEVESISALIGEMRKEGARVYAAALKNDAKKLGSFDLELGNAIVIGNEGHGLSDEVITASDECLFIPMEQGSESLNASIAASVCMWELYKTKMKY